MSAVTSRAQAKADVASRALVVEFNSWFGELFELVTREGSASLAYGKFEQYIHLLLE